MPSLLVIYICVNVTCTAFWLKQGVHRDTHLSEYCDLDRGMYSKCKSGEKNSKQNFLWSSCTHPLKSSEKVFSLDSWCVF